MTPGAAIPHHGRPTSHFPELVLSNFSTPLGLSLGTLLQSCFPPLPDLSGRQVVSLQNSRDFVFVRRWRYAFAKRDEVLLKPGDEKFRTRLQELGPRFTLKLRWLKRGTLAGSSNQEVLVGEEGKETMKDQEADQEERREGSKKGREREEKRRREEEEEERLAAEEAGVVELGLVPPADDSLHPPPTPDAETKLPEREEKKQAKKGKRKRKPSSSGVHEAFLRGDDVDSPSEGEGEGAAERPATRQGGGLADYMKGINDRLNGKNVQKKRELEFEWQVRMRSTSFLALKS